MNKEDEEKFKKIIKKTLDKLVNNSDELFDNYKLQKKYNNSLKEQIKLQKKEIKRLNNIIIEAREKSIKLQEKYGYILDDLTYLLMQNKNL